MSITTVFLGPNAVPTNPPAAQVKKQPPPSLAAFHRERLLGTGNGGNLDRKGQATPVVGLQYDKV